MAEDINLHEYVCRAWTRPFRDSCSQWPGYPSSTSSRARSSKSHSRLLDTFKIPSLFIGPELKILSRETNCSKRWILNRLSLGGWYAEIQTRREIQSQFTIVKTDYGMRIRAISAILLQYFSQVQADLCNVKVEGGRLEANNILPLKGMLPSERRRKKKAKLFYAEIWDPEDKKSHSMATAQRPVVDLSACINTSSTILDPRNTVHFGEVPSLDFPNK